MALADSPSNRRECPMEVLSIRSIRAKEKGGWLRGRKTDGVGLNLYSKSEHEHQTQKPKHKKKGDEK
jgi:hypothetical protein